MAVQHTDQGTGAPSSIPPSVGAHYTDLSTGDQYLSHGTSSPADWGRPLGKAASAPLVAVTENITLGAAHQGALIAGSGVTVTVPTGLPLGFAAEVVQTGEEPVEFAAAGTELVHASGRLLRTGGQWQIVRLVHLGGGVWFLANGLASIEVIAGITWATQPLGGDAPATELAWSSSLGIAVAAKYALATTTDGVTWTQQIAPGGSGGMPFTIEAIARSDSAGKFVAFGKRYNEATTYDDVVAAHSVDGLAWSEPVVIPVDYAGSASNWRVMWSAVLGKFVFTAGDTVAVSADGVTWTHQVREEGILAVIDAPELGMVVAISQAFKTDGALTAITTTDGASWTVLGPISTEPSVSAEKVDLAWSPELGELMLIGGGKVFVSPDGAVWEKVAGGTGGMSDPHWARVVWSSRVRGYVGVANGGGGSADESGFSRDGRTWTRVGLGTEGPSWASVIEAPELGKFLAVHMSGTTAAGTANLVPLS